jgi:phage-related protein
VDQFPSIEAPDWGLTDEPKADVNEVSLGDGYVIRQPKGINSVRDSWSPEWSGLEVAVARSTFTWLRNRLGVTPFLWIHPVTGKEVKVICRGVRLGYNEFNDEILSASFEQDFNPS